MAAGATEERTILPEATSQTTRRSSAPRRPRKARAVVKPASWRPPLIQARFQICLGSPSSGERRDAPLIASRMRSLRPPAVERNARRSPVGESRMRVGVLGGAAKRAASATCGPG